MNILSPFGWIYAGVMGLRNTLRDLGLLASQNLGIKTISVGNITLGGTGKTPLVALIAKLLADNGEKVCVLTRGYGRENAAKRVIVSDSKNLLVDARIGGDEPVELARELLGKATVIADRDREAAARFALSNFDPTVFILDDAFQHHCVARDLDIVCIDATNPFGNGEVLPAGTLRERPANLARADVVVITRSNLVEDISHLRSEISKYAPRSRTFEAGNRIAGLISLSEFVDSFTNSTSADAIQNPKFKIQNQKGFAFCGIGNPSNFFRQLQLDGYGLDGQKAFPDHYYYNVEDVRSIEKKALAAGAKTLVTTAKDAVRLTGIEFTMPCYVVQIEQSLGDDAGFRELIFS